MHQVLHEDDGGIAAADVADELDRTVGPGRHEVAQHPVEQQQAGADCQGAGNAALGDDVRGEVADRPAVQLDRAGSQAEARISP